MTRRFSLPLCRLDCVRSTHRTEIAKGGGFIFKGLAEILVVSQQLPDPGTITGPDCFKNLLIRMQ